MIHNNPFRNGNFTSSEIAALTGAGKRKMTADELSARPKTGEGSKSTLIEDAIVLDSSALTYILECNMERRLGRSLTDECNAKPLLWGKLLEGRVNYLLGLEYSLTSEETKVHPLYNYWAGSKDVGKKNTIGDIKCPMTLKSFCQLVQPLYDSIDMREDERGIWVMNAIRNGYTKDGVSYPAHKDGEKYYWQLVSNSCIESVDYAELIVYVPYLSEIPDVRLLAQQSDNPEKFYWLMYADTTELPYLVDGGYYKNLNTIRFKVPKEDKEYLTNKVSEAGKYLIPFGAERDFELNTTLVNSL